MRALSLCSLVVVMSAPWLLAGCQSASVPAPLAESYPYSTQQRLQAAEHWALLARHEAEQMLLNERLRVIPLYIRPVSDGAGGEFFRSYRNFLTSALVARGARISTVQEGAAEVQISVELIQHRGRNTDNPPTMLPILAYDWLYGGASASVNDEVVITTQALESARVLYSGSNRYYINADDRRQYSAPATTAQPLIVPVFPVTNRWY